MFSKRFQVFLCYLFIMFSSVFSYTQIVGGGTNNSSDTGPKIYKATHMDLIFPEVFNRTREDSISETLQPKSTSAPILPTIPTPAPPEAQAASAAASIVMPTFNPTQYNEQISAESTGRAVDYRPYPFQQLISAGKPSYKPDAQVRRPVYPSYMTSNRGRPRIQDRFTPGEATAAHSFNRLKNANNSPYNPRPAASDTNANFVAATAPNPNGNYVPVSQQNLYSFPPNTDVHYPAPSDTKPEAVKANSYEWSAAGPPVPNGFTGPINPSYLPASDSIPAAPEPVPVPQDPAPSGNNSNPPPADDDSTDDGDSHAGEINVSGDNPSMDDHHHEDHDDHDHHHDDHDHHHDDIGYIPGKLYPTPPPGYIPEIADDHDPHHDHHHDHFPDHDVKAFDYHDLVYDDHFFHHHHHPTEPPPPPPPSTTEAPEPPPEPRVKKYSYFYIGRKLWYIPLYFTVWFSFYVLWLILKSIARHKVNLPNHYVAKRSLPDMSHKQATEHIDKLTVYVLDNIEKFKDKYFG